MSKLILMSLFLTSYAYAQSGTTPPMGLGAQYEQFLLHPSCEVYYSKEIPKGEKRFVDAALKKLKEKGFLPRSIDFKAKIKIDDLYFSLERKLLDDSFYPPCQITLNLYKTKNEYILPGSDEKLAVKMAKRSHPRVSRDGFSRCKMAVQDAFQFFPHCKQGGIETSQKK